MKNTDVSKNFISLHYSKFLLLYFNVVEGMYSMKHQIVEEKTLKRKTDKLSRSILLIHKNKTVKKQEKKYENIGENNGENIGEK